MLEECAGTKDLLQPSTPFNSPAQLIQFQSGTPHPTGGLPCTPHPTGGLPCTVHPCGGFPCWPPNVSFQCFSPPAHHDEAGLASICPSFCDSVGEVFSQMP